MKVLNYRIFLYGGSCTGKTCFAKELKKQLDIPLFSLDNIFWYGDWENVGNEALLSEVNRIIGENESWIIDGNYRIVKENIRDKATHIYFCHNNIAVLTWRVLKRCLSKNREGVPEKIKESTDKREKFWSLFSMVLRYQLVKKKEDVKYYRKLKANGVNIKKIKCNKKNIEGEISIVRGSAPTVTYERAE